MAVSLRFLRRLGICPYVCQVAHCRLVNYLSDPGNTGKSTRGVNFDTLGSWNNRLDLGINLEESIRRGSLIPTVALDSIGVASLRGRRAVNEDRTIALELASNLLMFGIFDGHGGHAAADFVVERLPDHILQHLIESTDLSLALQRAFVDVNNAFTRYCHHLHACRK